jgi:CBS domain containing-hemolysin-like protein
MSRCVPSTPAYRRWFVPNGGTISWPSTTISRPSDQYVMDGVGSPLERLIRPVVRVAHDLPADRAIALLRDRRVHQAVVTDAAGVAVGLLTIQDVIGALLDTTAAKAEEARR